MFREVERRLDVVLHRACFAPTQIEATKLVRRGHVRLNGNIVGPAAPLSLVLTSSLADCCLLFVFRNANLKSDSYQATFSRSIPPRSGSSRVLPPPRSVSPALGRSDSTLTPSRRGACSFESTPASRTRRR